MLIAPFNNLETTSVIIEKHHDELGGVIVELFQRVLRPKPGFLEGLREITAHYEVPLIFDAIVTSFRFAFGAAQEFYRVTPDLCSLGKAVAGRVPADGGRRPRADHGALRHRNGRTGAIPAPDWNLEWKPGCRRGEPGDGEDPQASWYL